MLKNSILTTEKAIANQSKAMGATTIFNYTKIRKSWRNAILATIASIFITTSIFGQDGILPFLYLENKNGDILEIPFTDGTISIMDNQIFIYAQSNHYKYNYDDVERFYFKDKIHLILSDLTVSEGMLVPEFNGNIFNYSLNVPTITTSVTITAKANNPNATIIGDGLKELTNPTSTFTITVTADDSETALVYTITVNNITGIISNELFDVVVYPNPTAGKFTVHIPDKPDEWIISIYNMQGQKIEAVIISDEYTDIDINQYPAGVYLLEIISKSGRSITQKLVKE